MTQHLIAVLPGDGIGPEVTAEARRVLEALDLGLAFEEAPVGGAAYRKAGHPLPLDTLALAQRADAVLFGAVGDPDFDGLERALRPEQAILKLRHELALFANVRPARMLPGLEDASALRPEIARAIDLVIIRELTGDVYFGEKGRGRTRTGLREGHDLMRYDEVEVARIARVGFETAMRRRRRLISVDKANVLETSQLWREIVGEVARDYPEVKLTHMYCDNAAMQLVRAPGQFDVIVTGNLFGDILSDQASMCVGSIGMLPSASLDEDGKGLFEPIHGSAPDIAGQGKANPCAAILSAAMLLRYSLNRPDAAERVEAAVVAALATGARTHDPGRDRDHARDGGCGASGTGGMTGLLEIAVVIPTFNESANVATLVARLDQALAGRAWEAVFVDDDSPDGTAEAARTLGRVDRRVRVIQRIGRRGLSSACIEGMCATAAPVVAVIDGDLQHDETLLPAMLDRLQDDPALDLVVGSRFVAGGGTGEWDRDRVAKSALATRLSRRVLKADLSDPMSGFFAIRTELVRRLAPGLAAIGFKILLDIMTASPRPLAFAELPYTFRTRELGESKLDHVVAMEYLIALYDRMFGRVVPVRFAMFSAVGVLGVAVHFAVLTPLFQGLGWSFRLATILATVAALTFNFFLNNALTYRDRRLKGWRALFDGWVSFAAVCSVGAVANVGIASFLHDARNGEWATAALAGILVGAVWNYALSSRFVWGRY